jgi:hypothetical protein
MFEKKEEKTTGSLVRAKRALETDWTIKTTLNL